MRQDLCIIRLSVWLGSSILLGSTLGCAYSRRMTEAIPDAAHYSSPTFFEGRWRGNVGDYPGELRLQKDPKDGSYRGRFSAWQSKLVYELSATRDRLKDSETGGAREGNRLIFRWNDDRGGRGRGWLLISPNGRVVTGEFGFGDSAVGAGDWSFVRATAQVSTD